MRVQELDDEREFIAKAPKKSKKKIKKSLFWLKLILSFILCGMALILLAISPLFNISEIEVYGNRHYEKEAIIGGIDVAIGNNGFKAIGSNPGNILTLRYGREEEIILKNYPYIKGVTVRFVIPSKVRIDIMERKPLCTVDYFGTNLIMDNEGFAVDIVKGEEQSALPQVKGITIKKFELGQELKADNMENLRKAVAVIEAVEESDKNSGYKVLNLLKSIDVKDAKKVYLSIDSRIIVNMGDLQDLNYRIDVLKQIISRNIKKDDRGLLDFTLGENAVFIPEK